MGRDERPQPEAGPGAAGSWTPRERLLSFATMRHSQAFALVVVLVAAACTAPVPAAEPAPAPPAPEPAPVPPAVVDPPRSFEVRSGRVLQDETIGTALGRLGVDFATSQALVGALAGTFDFRRLRTGDELRVTTEGGALSLFEYRRGPVEAYLVRREGDALVGEKQAFTLEKQVVHLTATVHSSLYEAIQEAGEDPQLALALSEVFAWDIDFYLDPRKGDTFQVLVEKESFGGRTVRYGEILSAEYAGSLVGTKRVFRWVDPRTQVAAYYGEDGSSTRRAFLKSPLKFANITSKFGGRIHPVLKYMKQHQGVDYGAPTGTPIWAVGDGVVTKVGWGGGCGNMVQLRHANGLETVYCHMSKIGEGLAVGTRVAQKRVIGYVGKTGLATGPHLHYGVKRGGQFVNPLGLKFPPAEPVPEALLEQFREEIASAKVPLDGSKLAAAAAAPAVAQ